MPRPKHPFRIAHPEQFPAARVNGCWFFTSPKDAERTLAVLRGREFERFLKANDAEWGRLAWQWFPDAPLDGSKVIVLAKLIDAATDPAHHSKAVATFYAIAPDFTLAALRKMRECLAFGLHEKDRIYIALNTQNGIRLDGKEKSFEQATDGEIARALKSTTENVKRARQYKSKLDRAMWSNQRDSGR